MPFRWPIEDDVVKRIPMKAFVDMGGKILPHATLATDLFYKVEPWHARLSDGVVLARPTMIPVMPTTDPTTGSCEKFDSTLVSYEHLVLLPMHVVPTPSV